MAGNFVDDPSATLPGPKRDLRSIPAGADRNQYLDADGYNALRQALLDVKEVVEPGTRWSAAVGEVNASKAAAEAARDAALATGKVYPDTTTGLAATTEGAYFSVPATPTLEFLILYRKESGVAVEKKRYPSSLALPQIAPDGYVWSIMDGASRAAIGLREDGTFDAKAAAMEDLEVTRINGLPAADVIAAAVAAPHPDFGGELVFIPNSGQSLALGSDGTITTAQEHDSIGFPGHASAPAAYLPLTVANTQYLTSGESPMYGCLGHIKELVLEENGLAYADHHWQLLTCNNGWSGYAIDALSKGTTPFTRLMSQVTSMLTIAQAEGRSCRVGAVTWTQGESDLTMPQATYLAKLVQLAADYDADARAITGQAEAIPLICYQLCAEPADRRIGLAHLQAAQEHPTTIFLACPMYLFDYYDQHHIVALSSKWLGAYYGLAFKRIVVDKAGWEPLWPVSHRVQGAVINLRMNKRGLVLDTTQVPAQANYGFDLVDSGGGPLALSSVSIIGPDQVKIVAAATIPAGAQLRYGFQAASGKGTYVGGAGNLRDSQGDQITYSAISKRLDNWCVLFSRAL